MLYRQLWAKSHPDIPTKFHPLWCHLLDVAAVCKALLPRFGPPSGLPDSWLLYLVALHDIGKADPLFQIKVEELARPTQDAGLLKNSSGPISEPDKPFRHEARSAEWLRTHLQNRGWDRNDIEVVALAVAGHHGDFHPPCPPDDLRVAWEPLRKALAEDVAQAVGLTPDAGAPTLASQHTDVLGVRLSALIVLADWVASNDKLYDYWRLHDDWKSQNGGECDTYFARAQEQAKGVVERLRLDAESPLFTGAEPLTFALVWPKRSARPTQAALEAIVRAGIAPGLALIEGPMGEGKTESAIYLAQEWNRQRGGAGAYLALPTQATSNQMHDRYKAFLKDVSPGRAPRLVHGMAWLMDDESPSTTPQIGLSDEATEEAGPDAEEAFRAREWFANAKRALLAPEGVGTVDQALMAALNVKHGFLRLLGLSKKILIVDEVHAYDSYITAILCRLLVWCRALRLPVILLSATLSRTQKNALVEAYSGRSLPTLAGSEPYPLLTFAPMGGEPITHAVAPSPDQSRTVRLVPERGLLGEPRRIAALAAGLVRDGGCACVLVNTVRAAQQVHQALKTLLPPDADLLLFHARFRAERRKEIEDEVTSRFGKHPLTGNVANPCRPRRAVLVSTQVVEQSLDVDFDVMVTDIAPADLLLQRSGRLWRHDRGRTRFGWQAPTLHILLLSDDSLDFGLAERVYARETLLRTLALLHDRTTFDLTPGRLDAEGNPASDFRTLIEGCYGDGPLPRGHPIPAGELDKAKTRREDEQRKAKQLANEHLVNHPNPRVFSYAQATRAVDEADETSGKPPSYFRASTRLGDLTRPALILTDDELIRCFRQAKQRAARETQNGNRRWSPPRKWLKRFFLQRANVPARWLNASAAEGHEAILTDGPRWLRHTAVVLMPGGEWCGTLPGQNGNPDTPVVLRDDHDLGLSCEPLAAAPDLEPEADAQ